MGWASGSLLMMDVISVVDSNVSNHDTKVELYEGLIKAFEEADCDTLDECLEEDEAFDEAYKNVHERDEEDGYEYDDD